MLGVFNEYKIRLTYINPTQPINNHGLRLYPPSETPSESIPYTNFNVQGKSHNPIHILIDNQQKLKKNIYIFLNDLVIY